MVERHWKEVGYWRDLVERDAVLSVIRKAGPIGERVRVERPINRRELY